MKRHVTQLLASVTLMLTFLLTKNTLAQTTVVIPGNFQSEVGCTDDWQSDCDATRLKQTSAGIWEGTFYIPAGYWEYKIAYDNSWSENYGAGGVQNGPNLSLNLAYPAFAHFSYATSTHLVDVSFKNSNVVLAGDFQSEIGCSADWQADCYTTGLYFDAANNLWKGQLKIPAGNWQFKVTIDGSWSINYGEGGVAGGPNILLNLGSNANVSFTYNPETHIVSYKATEIPEPETVVIPGTFQSKLGCTANYYNGDWEPACDFTRLTFDSEKRVWTGSFDLPAGYWEYKVAVNNSWAENYGANGIQGGPNIPLYLEAPANIKFIYNHWTHLVTLEYNTTTLRASTFYDANVNGYNDENIPMEGIPLKLTGKDISVQQATGNDGNTLFTRLTPGVYLVEETIPVGYLPTTLDSQTLKLTEPKTLHFGQVCLGSAGAMEIGYWMSKQGKTAFENNWNKIYILQMFSWMYLRNNDGSQFAPTSYDELRTWMQNANAKNMSNMLSAQLATLLLNIQVGQVSYERMVYTPGIGYMGANRNFMNVYSLAWYTSWQLYQYPTAVGNDKHRSELEALKNLLEQVNKDQNFVQLQPCGANPITSIQAKTAEKAKDLDMPSKAKLWPNPSGNRFILRPAIDASQSKLQIRVMDANGRQVYITTGSAYQDYHFGEDFAPGVYFVELMQDSKRTVFKIMKQ